MSECMNVGEERERLLSSHERLVLEENYLIYKI